VRHRYGLSSPFSVGLEEEFFVLDASALEPAPVPADVLDGDRLKAELFTTMLELATGIHADVGSAVAELADLRREARRRLAEHGLVAAAAGTWPTAVPEEQPVTAKAPLLRFAEHAGPSARRQYCAGLHVHVGVASPEECMGRLEAVLPWLPLLLAVSAGSPYLAGAETGLLSTRAEILTLLPRSGAPPACAGHDAFVAFAESLVAAGLSDDLMRLWWDVRPHPRLGTLEVRMPDQPTRLASTAALAALAHALVASAEPVRTPADRGVYAQNRWTAARFGPAAELLGPGGRTRPAGELVGELLERVRPVARRLGSEELLAGLEGLDQAGEQLELGRREGLSALCGRLVRLTYDGL
jgi:carboxylate-amine ligase